MPRPQAKSSSGSAPARASCAASPTLVSSAEETTQGSPAASATCSERRTPPERGALDHRDVGGARDRDPQRVLGAADGLVGGDAHVDLAAYGGQFLDGAAGLLDVLQPACCLVELADVGHGGVDVPDAVGVHPDRPVRAQRVADRLDAGEVFGQGLGVVGDLDLGRAAARTGGDVVGAFRADRRNGAVDRNAIAHRFGPAQGALLDRGGQPGSGLAVVVVGERAELAPSGGAFDQHPFAHGDAPEPGTHGDGVDTGGVEVDVAGHQSGALVSAGAAMAEELGDAVD